MSPTEFVPLLPWIILGVTVGTLVGAIPGLTGAMVIALTVPLTFAMEGNSAMALLVSLYTGSVSGGLIAATLLKVPGTPASMITILDAYPMTEDGRARQALSLGIGASFIGGILSGIVLLFLARPMAEWSVRLSPFDLFSLATMALVFIVAVAQPGKEGILKGIVAGSLGCLLALPGINPATGEVRYTFGWESLNDGFNLLPVLIGLFAASQAVLDLCTGERPKGEQVTDGESRSTIGWPTWLSQRWNLLRSSLIGTGIGILPGIGANVGSTIAYGVARNLSKRPERFGKGSEEGLVASESANNATVGGALIPLVSLGIPGSVVDAILLGALVIHGLQPGPLLFENHPGAVYAIIISYLASNFVMLGLMKSTSRWIALVANVSRRSLAPIILVSCLAGTYSIGNRIFDVWTMVVFGILGILFQRWKIPAAPLVIGFVLAPIAEENLVSGLMITGGDWAPHLRSPFSLICLFSGLLIVATTLLRGRKKGVAGSFDNAS